MITVTLKDIVTGSTAIVSDINVWSWTEGNWSCDCNRTMYFSTEIQMEMDPDDSDFCLGRKRIIVINAEGDFSPYNNEEEFIAVCNKFYEHQ